MGDSFRKIEMPDDSLVERGMSEAERAEHQRKLAKWRERQDEEAEGGAETE